MRIPPDDPWPMVAEAKAWWQRRKTARAAVEQADAAWVVTLQGLNAQAASDGDDRAADDDDHGYDAWNDERNTP